MGPRLYLTKTRGSETTIVNNNDVIGEINFNASDGVDVDCTMLKSSQKLMVHLELDDIGKPLCSLMTKADGSSSPTQRMRIGQVAMSLLVPPPTRGPLHVHLPTQVTLNFT